MNLIRKTWLAVLDTVELFTNKKLQMLVASWPKLTNYYWHRVTQSDPVFK
jgi:hypothetical protein